MSNLNHISTEEMLNDLAESRMDMFTHMKLGFNDDYPHIRVNRQIIEAIKPELVRRGVEVPPCTFHNVP